MTTVNQYRVWCTAGTPHYETTWGTEEPTICPSDAGPIDTSLTTVVQTVSDTDVEVTNLPTNAFGDLATTENTPLVQLYFTYNNNPQFLKSSITPDPGPGSVTNSDSMGVVSSGAAAGSSANLVSVKPIKYRSGQGILGRFTAVFTPGVVGNMQLVGLYDSENGLGFGYNGATFGLFHRKGGVTTWTAQTAWNKDKLDGTGSSGVNINFGDGNGNVFQVQYQYLGFGALFFYVENPVTGKWIQVHVIEYSNTTTTPSFTNPSLNLCIESVNDTNSTNVVVKTASMMAAVQGYELYTGPTFTNTWSGITVGGTGNETLIVALRVKTVFSGKTNKTTVYGTNIAMATGTNDKPQIIRLRKNATFTSPVWADVDTAESTVEHLTSGTWDSGTGKILYQGMAGGGGLPFNIPITPSQTSIYGVADQNIVITCEGLTSSGGGSNWGSISWLEDQ